MRVGLGVDVHRFEEGRRLILGGVQFQGETGLAGHSDADVLTHAVMDAVLGAAGLGDIGEHFPDDDERWKDASSIELLGEVVGMLSARSYNVVNVDISVVAERPRLSGRIDGMRKLLAERLGIDPNAVSIKATMAEGLGSVGRGEGIAAFAVALIDEDR